jgi:hypothetical protein
MKRQRADQFFETLGHEMYRSAWETRRKESAPELLDLIRSLLRGDTLTAQVYLSVPPVQIVEVGELNSPAAMSAEWLTAALADDASDLPPEDGDDDVDEDSTGLETFAGLRGWFMVAAEYWNDATVQETIARGMANVDPTFLRRTIEIPRMALRGHTRSVRRKEVTLAQLRPDLPTRTELPLWIVDPDAAVEFLAAKDDAPSAPPGDRPYPAYRRRMNVEIVAFLWRTLATERHDDSRGLPSELLGLIETYLQRQGIENHQDVPKEDVRKFLVRHVLRQWRHPDQTASVLVPSQHDKNQ